MRRTPALAPEVIAEARILAERLGRSELMKALNTGGRKTPRQLRAIAAILDSLQQPASVTMPDASSKQPTPV